MKEAPCETVNDENRRSVGLLTIPRAYLPHIVSAAPVWTTCNAMIERR